MPSEFRRDNHYVPRSYLKRWSLNGSEVSTYRILVPHVNVPLWRDTSVRGICYHEHLYTRIVASGESDAIERWLDTDFEAPAEAAIERVLSERRLTPDHWKTLVRLFAAQDARTPARLMECLTGWSNTLPSSLQETLSDSVAALEKMTSAERAQRLRDTPRNDDMPFRVTIQRDSESGGGWVKAETVIGRQMWLSGLKRLLSHTVHALSQHRWTVVAAPAGIEWFTSDAPAMRLNYYSPSSYDFGGGWGSVGTELMLPLGPRNLLYTQVGRAVPPRGREIAFEKATFIQKVIAEHAHRFIFALKPDPLVAVLRPRVVDAAALRSEAEQWANWHRAQSDAERELLTPAPIP
jgi:hypothetical protein